MSMTNITKKISNVLSILFIIQIIFAIVNVSQAASWFGNVMDSAENWYDKGKNAAASGAITTTQDGRANITIATPKNSDLQSIISDIYNILFPIGVAVTVIIGGVLGTKFMMASADDKAKIKESMIPYVAGCIVIYGAFGIWKLAIIIFSSL